MTPNIWKNPNYRRPIMWPIKTCARMALSQWKNNWLNRAFQFWEKSKNHPKEPVFRKPVLLAGCFFFSLNFWCWQKIPRCGCMTFLSKVGCNRAEKGGLCELTAAKSWSFGSKFHNPNWSAHRKNSQWTRPGNGQTRLVLLRNDQKKIFQQGVVSYPV